jgi:phosphohistidine phosphatase SixA
MHRSIWSHVFVLCSFLALAASLPSGARGAADLPHRGTRVVFVLRHAEKSGEPKEDPALADSGLVRARQLARFLDHAKVTGLYATNTRRAQETLGPLAEETGLAMVIGDIDDPHGLARRVLMDSTETAVVVAHGDTVGPIVESLVGQSMLGLGAVRYDDLFMVILPPTGNARLLRLKYGAPSS